MDRDRRVKGIAERIMRQLQRINSGKPDVLLRDEKPVDGRPDREWFNFRVPRPGEGIGENPEN